MKDVAYVGVSATLKYHFLRNHTSNSTTFYGHHTSAFRYGNHVDWEFGWGGTSVKGPERDKLPLFESSARLTTVNAGPIDPLVTMLFCLEVSEKLPQG